MDFPPRVPERNHWRWILGLLLAASALENAAVGSQEDALAYRVFQETLVAPFVVLSLYWPFRFLLGLMTQQRVITLTWAFWVFTLLAVVEIVAFPFTKSGDSPTNIESITAIAVAWASAALLHRTKGSQEGTPSTMNYAVSHEKRETAFVALFGLLSAAGILGSAVSYRGAGSSISIPVTAVIYGVSAGAVAVGLNLRRRWTYPWFLVWVGSSLAGAASVAISARIQSEKVVAFAAIWSLVVFLLGRAVRSRTRAAN